jgi:hypothetical protein
MVEIVICERDAKEHPEAVSKIEMAGYKVAIEKPEDIVIAVQMRGLISNVADMLEEINPMLVERDFGKRGKKRKRKKDWHR